MYIEVFICLKCLDVVVEIEIRFVIYYVVYNILMFDYFVVLYRLVLIILMMIENIYCIYMYMYRIYLIF